ncbi:hypothetical protein J6590_047515 [Homalodisca vitripennis]|nr:hypothetical protein J6590_047515 [Homalodisca vitripennis]
MGRARHGSIRDISRLGLPQYQMWAVVALVISGITLAQCRPTINDQSVRGYLTEILGMVCKPLLEAGALWGESDPISPVLNCPTVGKFLRNRGRWLRSSRFRFHYLTKLSKPSATSWRDDETSWASVTDP